MNGFFSKSSAQKVLDAFQVGLDSISIAHLFLVVYIIGSFCFLVKGGALMQKEYEYLRSNRGL